MANTKRKVKINWLGITWLILLIISIIFYFVVIGFIAFPPKYVLPFALILILLDLILGILSLKKLNLKKKKKSIKKIVVTIINVVLSIFMIVGIIYVPILQSQLQGVFVEPQDTQEVRINAYVMTSEYKSAHSELFSNSNTSTDLADYKSAKFITQSKIDQDNQAYALEDIQKQLSTNSLDILSKNNIIDSVSALYDGSGDVLLMNETYEATIREVPGRENFSNDTQILYTVVRNVTIEKKEKVVQDYTNTPFMVFIAGSDSRDSTLEYYTRTDTDLLLTVDPVHKQVLLISVPRDWYVKNPALGDGYDKLTHLGNSGLQNTMDGLNEEFTFNYIKNYFEVNFTTFYNIVEAIGGVDIYNPYSFTLNNGASSDTGHGEQSGYLFEEGNLHLNGDQALSYVRERYNLPNGDYGRNEHQAIVLQAIISKLTSKELISNFNNLLNSLQGNFLTSMSSDDIYSLAQMQLNDGGTWNFVTYHLGGVGGNDVTASMGDQLLYVSYPISEQVDFVKNEMTKVMNGDSISQGTLPEAQ